MCNRVVVGGFKDRSLMETLKLCQMQRNMMNLRSTTTIHTTYVSGQIFTISGNLKSGVVGIKVK